MGSSESQHREKDSAFPAAGWPARPPGAEGEAGGRESTSRTKTLHEAEGRDSKGF